MSPLQIPMRLVSAHNVLDAIFCVLRLNDGRPWLLPILSYLGAAAIRLWCLHQISLFNGITTMCRQQLSKHHASMESSWRTNQRAH